LREQASEKILKIEGFIIGFSLPVNNGLRVEKIELFF